MFCRYHFPAINFHDNICLANMAKTLLTKLNRSMPMFHLLLFQELVHLIKNTKIPIITMCNDRNHPKIRTLSNHCFDLRFQRPRLEQIKVCVKFELPHDKTNKMAFAPSEDLDQHGHPPSLIRVFAVHMKKAWVFSFPGQQRL